MAAGELPPLRTRPNSAIGVRGAANVASAGVSDDFMQRFAEGVFRHELSQFSQRLREELRQDLREILKEELRKPVLSSKLGSGPLDEAGKHHGMLSTLDAHRPARPPPLMPLTPAAGRLRLEQNTFDHLEAASLLTPTVGATSRHQDTLSRHQDPLAESHEWARRNVRGFRRHHPTPKHKAETPPKTPKATTTPDSAGSVITGSLTGSGSGSGKSGPHSTLKRPKVATDMQDTSTSIVEIDRGINGVDKMKSHETTPIRTIQSATLIPVRSGDPSEFDDDHLLASISGHETLERKAETGEDAGSPADSRVQAWSHPMHESKSSKLSSRSTRSRWHQIRGPSYDSLFEGTTASRESDDFASHALCECLAKFVRNPLFDLSIGLIVLVNAVVVGIQVDYVARNRAKVPSWCRAVEIFCCAAFAVEIFLRFLVYGYNLFRISGRYWNLFDTLMVSLQITEEILFAVSQARESLRMNFTFMRCLRMLRVIRLLRIVIIFRIVGELRTLIASIKHSLSSLGWTVVLLSIVIYVSAVWFTQIVADYEISNPQSEYRPALQLHYGSLGRTALSLYESVTGGLDWNDAVTPLMKSISPWMAPLFSMYIAFVVFAVLNIVTGVFVQTAMSKSREDTDMAMKQSIMELFEVSEQDGSCCRSLTLEDFEAHMDTPQMNAYFEAIDVDTKEAKGVFQLLDLDNSGSIDREEFLSGCLRLRGPAKALDLALLMHEVRCLGDFFNTFRIGMEEFIHSSSMTRIDGGPDSVEDVLGGALVESPQGAADSPLRAGAAVKVKDIEAPFSP